MTARTRARARSRFLPRNRESRRDPVSGGRDARIITLEGPSSGRGREGHRCRLTPEHGVELPYLYSSPILSYHFALRQVNRPPAYRKPSERRRDSRAGSFGARIPRKTQLAKKKEQRYWLLCVLGFIANLLAPFEISTTPLRSQPGDGRHDTLVALG